MVCSFLQVSDQLLSGHTGKRIDALWQQLERAADELRFAGVSTQQLIAHLQKGADHD